MDATDLQVAQEKVCERKLSKRDLDRLQNTYDEFTERQRVRVEVLEQEKLQLEDEMRTLKEYIKRIRELNRAKNKELTE